MVQRIPLQRRTASTRFTSDHNLISDVTLLVSYSSAGNSTMV